MMKKENQEEEDLDIQILWKSWFVDQEEEENDFFDGTEMVEKVGNRTYLIVVIYDIVDNKKRTKMAKALLGYGERVQRSAFECHLTKRKYERMMREILEYIDEEKDLLRIYKLTANAQTKMWGNVPETIDEDFIII